MAKKHGTKTLTLEEKEQYDLRRDAVIDSMPRTYWILIKSYCKKKKKKEPNTHEVYSFMQRLTYKADLLEFLEGFVCSIEK